MKKLLLSVLLLFESYFLFSNSIEKVIIQKGDSKWLSIYTSGNNWGYTNEQLGDCAVVDRISGNSVVIIGVERGHGIYYTWQGDYFKFYSIKVVDVVCINIPEKVSIVAGEGFTYTPIITDMEAETTLSWTSSNTSVATVNNSGTVTAVSPGQTTITCTASNGIKAQSIVTVSPLLLSNVTLNKNAHEMNIGDNVQLTTSFIPADATTKEVRWISSNDNVVQVDNVGNITAIAPGFCSIYAIASDGSGKFDKCLIHVIGTGDVKGDINGDGGVTPQDASMILQYVAKKITW